MDERLSAIFSEIPNCDTFCDIGCDHGYLSLAMIKSKCSKVYFSDISIKCLNKAEKLLSEYVKSGKAIPVLSNGFKKLPKTDAVLIAGMGGEETVKIINGANKDVLPETFVLQPMKNVDKVRVCLIENGYKIQKDYVFKYSENFYDLIVAVKGEDVLTQNEIEFGRDNLLNKGKAFTERIKRRISLIDGLLKEGKLSEKDAQKMKSEKERLNKLC